MCYMYLQVIQIIIIIIIIIGLVAPAYRARTQYIGKVWMKNNIHGFTYNKKLLSVKPCMLFFIQTLPHILCAGAISHASFLDLLGPIVGATNPIMSSLLQRIG